MGKKRDCVKVNNEFLIKIRAKQTVNFQKLIFNCWDLVLY